MKEIRWFHVTVACVIFITIAMFFERENNSSLYHSYMAVLPLIIIACIICYFVYKKQIREEIENERLLKEKLEEAERIERERGEMEESRICRYNEDPRPSSWNMDLTVNVVSVMPNFDHTESLKSNTENFKAEKEARSKKLEENKGFSGAAIVEPGKSKAEQEGNTTTNKDGKPVVKPNYKMIASEWVSNNLGLLNKICNDAYAISDGDGSYSATIPADFLPEERATWIIIGKTLVAEDDISDFKIEKDGLEVIVN